MASNQRDSDPLVHGERRAPEPLLYTTDQLLGRRPIRLRRSSDKRRFVAHLLMAVVLLALVAWWVIPAHAFAGPVIVSLTSAHGVHLGDLPSLLFAGAAAWSLLRARTLALARG
jgi:hypothetical protein